MGVGGGDCEGRFFGEDRRECVLYVEGMGMYMLPSHMKHVITRVRIGAGVDIDLMLSAGKRDAMLIQGTFPVTLIMCLFCE